MAVIFHNDRYEVPQRKERLHLFGDIESDALILGNWYHICIKKLCCRVDDGIWLEEGEKK